MIELTDVRALTLQNPWAHLIAHGTKRVENRTWMPPEWCDRLFIHVGKGWDNSPVGEEWRDSAEPIATSAIVAVADVAHGCNTSRWTRDLRCGCDPAWAMPGQCHWVLNTVWTLPVPVPCRGAQGLWRPKPETVEAVAAHLAAVKS